MFYQIISLLLVAIGGTLLFGSSVIFDMVLKTGLQLKENSYLEKLWSTNPMPSYLDFYMFNWTNPEDLTTPVVKPKLKEIGPFSFSEHRQKKNITWNQNGTVTYRQHHTYYFDRERSVADFDYPITTLNAVMITIGNIALTKDFPYLLRKGLQMTFNQLGQKLAVTKPFGNYIFDGYSDPLLAASNILPMVKFPFGSKMAWFYNRNGTSFGGDFTIGTQFHNFGLLEEWDHSNRTPHYEDSYGALKETALELHRANLKKSISLFVPDMCRSIPLDFEKEVEVEGIVGWKFTAGKKFLDNGTLYPENKCYCPGICPPSGAVNISSCKYNVPVFISLPNFYLADDCHLNGVEGVNPDESRHELYIILEPITGSILKIGMRLQANIYLQPIKFVSMFEKVPTVMFPLLWFEEVVQAPNFIIYTIKFILLIPLLLKIIGSLLILIGLFAYIRKRLISHNKKKSTQKSAEPIKQAS